MSKKKKASAKKKKVGDVSVYTVETMTMYVVRVKRGRDKADMWFDVNPASAYNHAYKLALMEREARGLEQGSMKVIFPDTVK